ncbi:hypothetical protein FRC10_009941 [Ceratobasidium sp. 414]|nr:hypothetical protein FRC10_009941 [Ceratobasidium sp. 414]
MAIVGGERMSVDENRERENSARRERSERQDKTSGEKPSRGPVLGDYVLTKPLGMDSMQGKVKLAVHTTTALTEPTQLLSLPMSSTLFPSSNNWGKAKIPFRDAGSATYTQGSDTYAPAGSAAYIEDSDTYTPGSDWYTQGSRTESPTPPLVLPKCPTTPRASRVQRVDTPAFVGFNTSYLTPTFSVCASTPCHPTVLVFIATGTLPVDRNLAPSSRTIWPTCPIENYIITSLGQKLDQIRRRQAKNPPPKITPSRTTKNMNESEKTAQTVVSESNLQQKRLAEWQAAPAECSASRPITAQVGGSPGNAVVTSRPATCNEQSRDVFPYSTNSFPEAFEGVTKLQHELHCAMYIYYQMTLPKDKPE